MSQHPWGASNAKNVDNTEACRGQQTYSKCGEKDIKEDCLNEFRCPNCQQEHLGYSRTCNVHKNEKEILEIMHKRNITFLEARKIVGSYMGENTCASIAQKVDPINQDKKYRALVEKLI